MKFKKVILCLSMIYSSLAQAQNTLPQQSNELAKSFSTKDTLFKTPFIDIDEMRDKEMEIQKHPICEFKI